MSKFIMMIVLGGLIAYGVSNITQKKVAGNGRLDSVDTFSNKRISDMVDRMIQVLLLRLSNDPTYRAHKHPKEYLNGVAVSYSVSDTSFKSDSLFKITVTAEFKGIKKTKTTYANQPTGGWIPSVIRGAWTANSNLNNTISDMLIDGRDHDLNLNIIPSQGVYGISSSVDFTNVENAAIGGTNNFVDYPMTYPEVPQVIEENYNWGGLFPETPDAILGYPEGTLKVAAQTGEFGSQYLYDPHKVKIGKKWFIDGLTYPLSGITYIEMTSADEVELMLMQTGNSGIIVVHKVDGDSHISGIKYDKDNSDGLFTGLLITDYSFHHHINILGAVIMLSPDLETSKKCHGNTNQWVYYSSEAISNATEIAAEITGLPGKVGYGYGKKRVNIKYMYE